ncbi:hypothetical protein [Pseudoalteromonas sp. MMG005]|uniref:hypothetical protein n=1 Tax=Pseudoalteromonas sp. MMG005 TaxID=2822682 RepID=UPI001B3A3A1A|nr:hypothetical protein [Pseudoalteromonas sp. MMG005]MBQ4844397.1 hypothetical protein [Pseudoalteromonas sp. MMG005]
MTKTIEEQYPILNPDHRALQHAKAKQLQQFVKQQVRAKEAEERQMREQAKAAVTDNSLVKKALAMAAMNRARVTL